MGGRVMCANAWSILAPSLVEKLILARTCSAVEIEGDAIMVGQTRPGTFSILFTLAVAAWYPTVTLAHGDEAPAQAVSLSGENYDPVSRGTRKLALGEVTIRMLIDASNIGRDDIEIGELILPADSSDSVSHAHGSLEIFYVVEGILGHEVNGKPFTLHPGEAGYLKPGDQIVHRVLSDGPVKALVIWVPGGEADAMVEHAGFIEVPLD
jgi:mannose-6-phosphate isomerase-like protein (cupin superfamily)